MKMRVILAAAALALAGCGNSDDTSTPVTTDNGTPVADGTATDTTTPPKDNGVTPDPGPGLEDVVIPTKKDTSDKEDAGPAIVVTGPPSTCFQAYVCAGECVKDDATCIAQCEEGGSDDIKAKLDAVLACQKAKCPTGTLDACTTDETQCWDKLKPCAYESAAGIGTCKEAFTCTRDCKGGDWACLATCFGKVNEEQQHDLVTYALCVKSYCGLDVTDQCLLEAHSGGGCGTAAGFCSG